MLLKDSGKSKLTDAVGCSAKGAGEMAALLGSILVELASLVFSVGSKAS